MAGRYLLFDIDDVMYLRRNHNICSVFVGTIPQNPQQNVFMGLPLELMPEEAQVLVEKGVAYVADDGIFHPAQLAALDAPSRRAYVQSLKSQGKKMQMAVIESQNRNMNKVAAKSKNKKKQKQMNAPEVASTDSVLDGDTKSDEGTSLFDSAPTPRTPNKISGEVEGYILTPTTSSSLLPCSQRSEQDGPVTIDVPSSYPLFAHLHDKGYYMMPGLRFGCDYNVYPGDPLRFHSHFAGVHFGWDEEITMMDLVGGGRLATSVKKGYLFGGAIAEREGIGGYIDQTAASGEKEKEQPMLGEKWISPPVRTFCLEWAGM